MYNFFALDAAVSPFDMVLVYLVYFWWIFALAGLLVISAIVGIVYFTKKKRSKKENK
jgi:hypothetical protein